MPEAAPQPNQQERVITILGSCVVSPDITDLHIDHLATELAATVRGTVFTDQVQISCEMAHPIDERLLWPLESWLTRESTGARGTHIQRVYNVLQGFGLTALRDVLGAGQRIPHLDKGLITMIQTAVNRVDGLTWEPKLPMSAIARMYWGLDVVPAFFIARSAVFGIRSVRGVIDSTVEDLAQRISLNEGREEPSATDRASAMYLYGEAVDYENKFTEAKKIILLSR